MSKKALLMILDGWGIGDQGKDDVIFNTPTPYWDSLLATYPHSELQASGENVGLPDGQMGNSEVGHLNIGAGRIVYQDLVKINRACADGSILFVTTSTGNQFAERFISSTVFGGHPENGVVSSFGVRTVVLQVHYFKVFGNRIIEWHRVTYKADLWLIVHREAMLITRLEVCGCTVPVFLSQDGVSLVTASSHRSYQCGKCYR